MSSFRLALVAVGPRRPLAPRPFAPWLAALGLVALCLALTGCQFVPKTQLSAAEAHARGLAERSRALETELQNREAHTRELEDRVRRAEEDLALLEQEVGVDRRQLANFQNEREELKRRVGSLTQNRGQVPLGASAQLEELSQKFPSLVYHPETGIAKLDVDVLFETADDRLRADAQRVLEEFAQIFQEASARDLKIMVVGHTDDRGIAKKPAREKFHNNWQLSTSRALAVAEFLQKCGVPQDRMGVTGFAEHQPVASTKSDEDRDRNRRVEIFVMGPEVPIVGWSETTPGVYTR